MSHTETKTATVVVAATHAAGGWLPGGTYRVEMPENYDASRVTGEDILCDCNIRIVEDDPLAEPGEIDAARAVEWGDVEDYYPDDEAEKKREAWNAARASWESERDAAVEAAEQGRLEDCLRGLETMARVEDDWGATPATDAVTAALAIHVEAGDSAEDYDHGNVVCVSVDGTVRVAWDQSLTTTDAPIGHLRPYSAESADRFLVTIEEMRDQHRASHRAADNWGIFPSNGATRRRVTAEEAQEIIEADPDGYARIVSPHFEVVDVNAAEADPGPAAGIVSRHPTQEAAEEAARVLLRDDPSRWLSIVAVDADGVGEPVVAQVEA